MTGMEIAALASAALSAGSGVASSISAGKMNKRGVEYATAENQRQRQYGWDMWNANNNYNDPKNQMDRLKNAGVNPHFYYGNGATGQTSQAVSGAPGGTMPNLRPVDYTSINRAGETMLQAEMMKAQIENIKADTAKKSEEATGQTLVNGISAKTLENMPTSIDLDNQLKGTNVELNTVKVQAEKQEIINKMSTNEEIKSRIENLGAQKQYTEQQTNNLITAMALTQAQIKTEGIKQGNITADTHLKKAEANYKNEVAKTQPAVRSNLASATAEANARTKNLGTQGKILEEDRKKAERSNFLGEKFDYGDRQNQQNTSVDQLQIIRQSYRNLMKDEQFKSLKIEEQEYINMNMGVDMVLSPITKTIGIKNSLNTSTTTTTFNKKGNYTGHRTTRRHR